MIVFTSLTQLTLFCNIILQYLAHFDDSPVCCKPTTKPKERGQRTRSVGHCYSCEGNHCEHTLYPRGTKIYNGYKRFVTKAISLNKTIMNHNCVQTTELQLGWRSPHCEPTPSAPFAALKKWRTDAARRDTQRRCWFVQSTIPPQKWRETRMMAQFESGQLKIGTNTALHNQMWISIFHSYQVLFYHKRKPPTKSPAV